MKGSSEKIIWAVIGLAIIVALGLLFWPQTQSPTTTPTDSSSLATTAYGDASSTMVVDASSTLPVSSINQSIKNNQHMITIQTNKGTIVFETYDADAPNTVKNFITLAQKGFYNGLIFHRVIDGFMIQGGDPTGTGRGGPGYAFADELNPATPSYQAGYVAGTVAMANSGPNTNGSQFFIMQADTPLQHSYTIFGHVISGMDVVNAIATTPTDESDRPIVNIVMEKVTVADVK